MKTVKIPSKKREEPWTDAEVYATINNAVIGLYKWKRIGPALADRPARFLAYARAISDLVKDSVTDLVAAREGLEAKKVQILSDAEIMLCLQLALCCVCEQFSDDNPMKASFLGTVVTTINSGNAGQKPEEETAPQEQPPAV